MSEAYRHSKVNAINFSRGVQDSEPVPPAAAISGVCAGRLVAGPQLSYVSERNNDEAEVGQLDRAMHCCLTVEQLLHL